MEFVINKNIILIALQKVIGICDKKTTLPILSHCLISVYDNKFHYLVFSIQ